MVYVSWAANALLFVAACFLAADTANAVLASMLREQGAREAPSPPEAARQTRPAWRERQAIVERNLFAAGTADSAPVVQEIDEDLEATKLPLKLLGTAAADDPALAWAAVMDNEARETMVVTLGDVLKQRAEVMRIERRRIVLLEDGENRELTFGDEDEAPAAVTRAGRRTRRTAARARGRGSNPAAAIRKLAEDRFAVSREQAERVLDDPTDILAQARFLPKYDGEEMVGFQISGIKQNSVLRDVGLNDGDLITGFNGSEINSPTDTARLLQEFNDSSILDIDIEDAEGNVRTVTVDLSEE